MGLIGTVGNIDKLVIGGVEFVSYTSVIKLQAFCTSTNKSTLREGFSTSGYQVTAAKTFYVLAMQFLHTSGTGTGITFGYGDNDVGISSGSTPTNAVNHQNYFAPASSNTAIPCHHKIPATKYAYFNPSGQDSALAIYGYEV